MEANSRLLIFIFVSASLFHIAARVMAAEPVSISSLYRLYSHNLPYKFRVVSKRNIDHRRPGPLPPLVNRGQHMVPNYYHKDPVLNPRGHRPNPSLPWRRARGAPRPSSAPPPPSSALPPPPMSS